MLKIQLFCFDLIEKIGPNRTHTVLRPGWTDMLFKIITRECGSECVYQFSKANICEREFKTVATCSECQGKVKVSSTNNRRQFFVDLTKGPGAHTNTKFRRLTKAKSNFLAAELLKKSVNDVYLNQGKHIPIDAENFPRDFVSQKSIANIKSKQNRLDDSATIALRIMKHSFEKGECIRELATDPFFVLFWTNKQQYYYTEVKKSMVPLLVWTPQVD